MGNNIYLHRILVENSQPQRFDSPFLFVFIGAKNKFDASSLLGQKPQIKTILTIFCMGFVLTDHKPQKQMNLLPCLPSCNSNSMIMLHCGPLSMENFVSISKIQRCPHGY